MHVPSIGAAGRFRAVVAAVVAAAILALAACSSGAAPTASDPNVQGAALVDQFFTILHQPDAAKADQLKTFLAPEFQVVRATGDQLGKDACLKNPPTVTTYAISDLSATQETINGVSQTTTAPRFSVFRWVDGGWHLAAHSNFGALSQ